MRIVRRLLWLAVFVGVLVLGWKFASSNAQAVPVDYLAGVWPEVPLWAVMLGSFGAGVLVTGFLSLFEVARQGFVARRYRKAAEGLESEIHQMRNLPLVTEDEETDPPAQVPTPERSA